MIALVKKEEQDLYTKEHIDSGDLTKHMKKLSSIAEVQEQLSKVGVYEYRGGKHPVISWLFAVILHPFSLVKQNDDLDFVKTIDERIVHTANITLKLLTSSSQVQKDRTVHRFSFEMKTQNGFDLAKTLDALAEQAIGKRLQNEMMLRENLKRQADKGQTKTDFEARCTQMNNQTPLTERKTWYIIQEPPPTSLLSWITRALPLVGSETPYELLTIEKNSETNRYEVVNRQLKIQEGKISVQIGHEEKTANTLEDLLKEIPNAQHALKC